MDFNPAETFIQEAEDLLAEIEACALQLQEDFSSTETIHQLFRAFHTIKGSGSMFGFDAVASFTHHVETLLDQVREGQVPVSEELCRIIMESGDQIKALFKASQGGAAADKVEQAKLLARVHKLSATASGQAPGQAHGQGAGKAAEADGGETSGGAARTWNIRFVPDPLMLARGCNPALLFRDLKKLGKCSIEAHTDRVPALDTLEPEHCYLWWTIRLEGDTDRNTIREVFLFVEDGAQLDIEPDAAEALIAAAGGGQNAVKAPEEAKTAVAPAAGAAGAGTVKVPAARLDRLVNLVGELVMNHSRLATAAARFASPEIAGPVEEIERLVSELRDDVLQIRMMPIGSIFGRFRRLVHDLSQQLGKEINLVTEGEETELDKSILDRLGEPLVHLLRNSIDHGIEAPDDRAAKGKSRKGTIRLVATHRGSDVVVSIADDGKGLDTAAIRAKAVARQIISADATLSDKEIFNLILLPGFSTAQAITSVSGRGVGMDVVKRQIDALRGTLTITSEAGRGSCMALTLPLTLAIIDGLLVECGHDQYIIPMAVVTENVELPLTERERNNGRNLVAVRGEQIPYIDLRKLFAIQGSAPSISKIVLVRHEDQRIGLVVDRVMDTHQTVIQALGPFFRNIEVVSGSTVMGDGRVALILDVAGVVRLADNPRHRRSAGQAAEAA
jgi:two-component system chemotaxis sensor kinase CheA